MNIIRVLMMETYEFFHAAGNVHDDDKTRACRFDDMEFRWHFVQICLRRYVSFKVRTLHDNRPCTFSFAHVVVFVLSFRVVLAVFAEMDNLYENWKKKKLFYKMTLSNVCLQYPFRFTESRRW